MKRIPMLPTLAFAVAACGGGEPADGADDASPVAAPVAAVSSAPVAPSGPLTMPDWFHVDADAQTVHMTLTAGGTPPWHYNDAQHGGQAITVPEGYTVTIDLVNEDPVMAHSLGISAEAPPFAGVVEPVAVFEGAMTENPASMVDSTMPGETETVTFVAEAAGNYTVVCYIAGHSLTGMWLYFNVSSDGSVGVQGA
jgi:FtsP/CotA-like multicopper oxidase with cupredoxin domain